MAGESEKQADSCGKRGRVVGEGRGPIKRRQGSEEKGKDDSQQDAWLRAQKPATERAVDLQIGLPAMLGGAGDTRAYNRRVS